MVRSTLIFIFFYKNKTTIIKFNNSKPKPNKIPRVHQLTTNHQNRPDLAYVVHLHVFDTQEIMEAVKDKSDTIMKLRTK